HDGLLLLLSQDYWRPPAVSGACARIEHGLALLAAVHGGARSACSLPRWHQSTRQSSDVIVRCRPSNCKGCGKPLPEDGRRSPPPGWRACEAPHAECYRPGGPGVGEAEALLRRL